MVSPSHLAFVFVIYKVAQFTLQKIWSPPKNNVQLPSLDQSPPSSSFPPCNYDVFLSFRGEDTRKTFVDHLYTALLDRQIQTYKDDETLPRGESISPSLFKAIEESQIAIIIFSKNYANSSWCLEELSYIMKCREERGLIVMPVFYDVDPTEVRKQNGDFGKAFAKQELENTTKAESWRKAVIDASNISGWEPKNIANGYESKVIKEIVNTTLSRLFPFNSNSNVDEKLAGMTTRMQDLKSLLEIGSGGVLMVGIWGVGGGGKTTLASSLYEEISCHFEDHHIIENIREKSSKYGLEKLQESILSAFLKTKMEVHNIFEGKHKMKRILCRRNVLIVLDDVNDVDQLEALAGSHKWFGSGSRIIITTRDKHLLRTHKVDHVYPVKLLSRDESIQVFNSHAFNGKVHGEDYEKLSLRVISYAAGLPLALNVLGSFLYDKDKNEWISTLDKLKDIPDLMVTDLLKISYDGLESYQKDLFLDIACFWRGKSQYDAMEILEACGYHPIIGIKVLRQKALISINGGYFRMHDLVQEMGYYIVRGEHPKYPGNHSRVWKHEDIRNMCFGDETLQNDKIQVITYDCYTYEHDDSSRFCKIVSNMKKLRWFKVRMRNDKYHEGPSFLSNELRYINWEGYPATPFPDNFQPMKLVVLKLDTSMQEELWKGFKLLPHLKVLELKYMDKLINTPDFDGLPSLQRLTLHRCYKLKEIHSSFGNHNSLVYASISRCFRLRMFPTIVHMKNLQELDLSWNNFSRLDSNISQLTGLKILNLSACEQLLELPELPSNLAILNANCCKSLTTVGNCHKNCKWLCQVSLMEGTIIRDGIKLLQVMLEAIENHYVVLFLQGVEVGKGFTPLFEGSRCTLQFPQNWCSDFCGFLMCAVFKNDLYLSSYKSQISMKHEMSSMDSQHDHVLWEVSDLDCTNKYTWVGYVSFSSLRHTIWWDQTNKACSFHIRNDYDCSGFGVRLVAKKSRSGLTETPTNSSYYGGIKIIHDSASALSISLGTKY